MTDLRHWITLCEAPAMAPTLYHGTCEEQAAALLQNGWQPNRSSRGGNMGQPRFLYLSTGFEDALWFAQEKGCDSVLEVGNVPLDHLQVDPEDGTGDTLDQELNLSHGLPGKVVLVRSLGPEHFRLASSHLDEDAGPDPLAFMDEIQAACEQWQVPSFYFEEGGCWGMALALHDRLPGSKLVVSYFRGSPSHAMVRLGSKLYDYSGETHHEGKLVTVTPERFMQIAAEAGWDEDEVLGVKEHAGEIIDSI